MKRPLPLIPRGPRHRRLKRNRLIFACPRVSPEWELGMLHVLMKPKPQTRTALEHRQGDQAWPANADAVLDEVLEILNQRIQTSLIIHRPPEGAYQSIPRRRRRRCWRWRS